MRFMILVKADTTTEAGVMPDEKQLAEMTKFNEELVEAGVMLAGDGLQPTTRGARISVSESGSTVTYGPFPSNDLIAGYWLWELDSLDDAIAWVKRVPAMGRETEFEIRQVMESADFGEAFTPELRAAEERMRDQVAARH